uniref:Transposase MuDR plant domain-containing protein n=1 Tax=Brassica oleracea var. oleracea TaxID=109376 RepID=A0A0D3E4P2_BRAOL
MDNEDTLDLNDTDYMSGDELMDQNPDGDGDGDGDEVVAVEDTLMSTVENHIKRKRGGKRRHSRCWTHFDIVGEKYPDGSNDVQCKFCKHSWANGHGLAHLAALVTRTLPDREAGDEDGTENDATGGVLTFHGDIEMHENFTERDEHVLEDTEVRPRVVYQPRDDGTSLVLGQEFRTKEEAKVHIQTASHQKCFEFDITKSDTTRFVDKCRGAKDGCKWFVRVAKLKNTDLWTVRSYIKQHICSVVTTRTLPDRRKGTSQIITSVLAQDYPGTFDTPVPKVLIDLVYRRVGVRVSYTSA